MRHEPGVHDGVQAFLSDLAVLTEHRSIESVELLIAENDFVFLVARGTHLDRPCVYADLYRVDSGVLVEHWGFPQDEPTTVDRINSNTFL